MGSGNWKEIGGRQLINGQIMFAKSFDVDNGVLLCIRHHVPWAHTQVVAFQEWIIERRGIAWWNGLVEKKNRGQGIGCIS